MSISINENDIFRTRKSQIKQLIQPLLDSRIYSGLIATSKNASTNTLEITLCRGESNWRLDTPVENFKVSYFEQWKKINTNPIEWSLEKAYATIHKYQPIKREYEEYLLIHCDPSFTPDENDRTRNPEGYKKQCKQEKYKRSIHLHLSFLGNFSKEKGCPFHPELVFNSCLTHVHLAVSIGRDTYGFGTLDEFSKAMIQCTQMIKDEILDEILEYKNKSTNI